MNSDIISIQLIHAATARSIATLCNFSPTSKELAAHSLESFSLLTQVARAASMMRSIFSGSCSVREETIR